MKDVGITEQLLADLLRRVRHAADTTSQAVELRKFLESVHKAMGRLLGFDAEKVHIDRWSDHLAKAAKDTGKNIPIHPDKYGPLNMIYRQGNIPAHENMEAMLLTSQGCVQWCREVSARLPPLVADMLALGHELEPEILRVRETAVNLHRAQLLFDAVKAAIGDTTTRFESEVWPTLEERLLAHGESLVQGLRKNPKLEKRVEKGLVAFLSQNATATDDCPLREFARALSDRFDLLQWMRVDDAQIAMMRQQPRLLNLFRVELDTVSMAEGASIRHAALFDVHGERTEVPGSYPIESRSGPELFRSIKNLFDAASLTVREKMGATLAPRDFVLQIAVAKDCSMQNWETLKPAGPRGTLGQEFLAVAIDPVDADDSHVDMREPLDATRMAIVWDADPQEVRLKYRTHSVLLAGPPAWQANLDGLPPVLWTLSQRAGAVLLPEAEQGLALASLQINDWPNVSVVWADLVQRVGELKRGPAGMQPGAYRIFLTDARYHGLRAYFT